AADEGEAEGCHHREMELLRPLPGEHLVEGELDEERDAALEPAEGEHEDDGEDAVRPHVRPQIAQHAPVGVHRESAPIISAAIAAARIAAPPRPSALRTSRRLARIAPWRAGSSRMARASAAMRGPLASACSSSGTTARPATMFGIPTWLTPRTSRRPSAKVTGERRYTITMGHSSNAHSSVAVPEVTSAMSEAAIRL